MFTDHKHQCQLTVTFQEEVITAIVTETQELPYFLHEWGYQVWNMASASPITTKDTEKSSAVAIDRLDRNFFCSQYERLSDPQ